MENMRSVAAKSARFHGRGKRSSYGDALGHNREGKRCAIVLVSVGKPNFEGPELKATLGLTDGICQHTTIVVSDTLQRFNREVEKKLTPEEALALTEEEGKDWESKCRGLIQELHRRKDFLYEEKKVRKPLPKGKYDFIHWDSFRLSPSFKSQLNIVNDLAEHNTEFSLALDASVDEYCQRRGGTLGENFSEIQEKYQANCRLYHSQMKLRNIACTN